MQSDDDDVVGQRAAGKTGTGTTRDERLLRVGENSYYCDGLVARGGKNRQLRLPTVTR
jgi:hypothetical protein